LVWLGCPGFGQWLSPDFKTKIMINNTHINCKVITPIGEGIISYAIPKNDPINTLSERSVRVHLLDDTWSFFPESSIKLVNKEISIDFIKEEVSTFFGITIEEMDRNTRKRESVQARQIAMYFSNNLTKYSLSFIGQSIGNKDHSTVLHAKKNVKNLIETDKLFKLQIEELESKFK
jgi:Bacterial dnaA protein helix-turn-helix